MIWNSNYCRQEVAFSLFLRNVLRCYSLKVLLQKKNWIAAISLFYMGKFPS